MKSLRQTASITDKRAARKSRARRKKPRHQAPPGDALPGRLRLHENRPRARLVVAVWSENEAEPREQCVTRRSLVTRTLRAKPALRARLIACMSRAKTTKIAVDSFCLARSIAMNSMALLFALSVLSPAAGDDAASAAERGRIALTTRLFTPAVWTTTGYKNAWKYWQPPLKDAPPDYDQAFREHYGLHPAPYPNGGLPMGLRRKFAHNKERDGLRLHAVPCRIHRGQKLSRLGQFRAGFAGGVRGFGQGIRYAGQDPDPGFQCSRHVRGRGRRGISLVPSQPRSVAAPQAHRPGPALRPVRGHTRLVAS